MHVIVIGDVGEGYRRILCTIFFTNYYESNISIKIKKVELELEGSREDI